VATLVYLSRLCLVSGHELYCNERCHLEKPDYWVSVTKIRWTNASRNSKRRLFRFAPPKWLTFSIHTSVLRFCSIQASVIWFNGILACSPPALNYFAYARSTAKWISQNRDRSGHVYVLKIRVLAMQRSPEILRGISVVHYDTRKCWCVNIYRVTGK